MTQITPSEVVAFWREAGPKKWFGGGPAFDAQIQGRFGDTHLAAARGDLADWENTAQSALALLLLVDQFPRNLYRHSAHAFATDEMARLIAERAGARLRRPDRCDASRVFLPALRASRECRVPGAGRGPV